MKKQTSFILVVFILVSACQPENEVNPSNTFEDEVAVLTELNHIGFNFATSNFDHNLAFQGNYDIGLNQDQFVNDILQRLNGQFFMANESVINNISNQYGEVSLSDSFIEAPSIENVNLSLFKIYSEDQLKLAQPFVDRLLITGDMEIAKFEAVLFQKKVIKSTLTNDEKLQLLTLSSGIVGFVEFVENGGIDKIRDVLGEHLNNNGIPNNRFRNCSVDTRSVLAGAVVSGAIAGGLGFKAGCAGGMVGGPIGAASGCVGGAVMGFASGFMWGAVGGIAASLLTTCFR